MSKPKTMSFSFDVEYIDKGTKRIKTRKKELSFCVNAADMTIGTFSQMETMLQNIELRYKVALGTKDIKSIDPLDLEDNIYKTNWTNKDWREYADIILDLLTYFCVSDKADISSLRDFDFNNYADVRELEDLFSSVYTMFNDSHELSEIQYFEHKGRRFIVPYSEDEIGIALTWGEVSEALQSNYMTKANADGRYGDDVLLNNSLTIVAALCREVRVNDTDGTFTELPVPKETMAFRTYVKERMQFFKDLPCSVARDVGFFLTISYIRFGSTTSLALLLSPHAFQKTQKDSRYQPLSLSPI